MVGKHFGPYRVLSPLGAGGMGEVYRAHDEKLGRDVALKVLPRAVADDPDRRARMVREARAAAALNHPNICTIHDVGDADGLTYIAMEVIEGQPLSARLADRPLSIDEVLRIGLQLAEAVAHAHDRGIVHRDLKSANVMLTPAGHVKVLDFGLAKRVSADLLAEASTRSTVPLTRPMTILGTLSYMSPEQLRGKPADAVSDVWAVGVILHEMTAGARPFDGTTEFEVSSAILNDEPAPLPARVPAALQTVIGRCLDKEPARRYQRASEVRAALEAVRASPQSSPVPAAPTARRSPAGILSAVALLAVAGGLWWLYASRTASRPVQRIQSIAVLPLENLSSDAGQEYFATGVHEALITDLARIGLQKVIAKPSVDAFKGTKKSLHDIAQELGVEGLVTGSVIRAGDRIQISAQLVRADTGAVVWANRYERPAGDVLSLQNDVVGAIAREVRASLSPEQKARLAEARPVNAAAYDAYLKGRSLLAAFTNTTDRKEMNAALAQFEKAEQLDPGYAPAYAATANVYLIASQMSLLPPRATMPKARAAAVKAVALDDERPEAHAALADIDTWYDWDWKAADREIQRALELNPDSVDALRVSEVFLTLVAGRFDEAARISQRILSLDPLNPFSRIQPIWIAFFSRRYDESIRHAKSLGDVWPGNPMSPFFLASNYAVKRMAAETGAACGTVMKALADALVVQSVGMCAWAYATVGETDQARRLVQRLEHPPADVWVDPAVVAQAYAGLGDVDRAIDWCRKGLDERSALMIYMKTSAMWDPVRGDPRFQAMLRQMNFPA